MPKITLTDTLGASIETDADPLAPIAEYLKVPTNLHLAGIGLAATQNAPLKDSAVHSIEAGLNFKEKVPVDLDNTKVTVAAGASGSIKVFGKKGETVIADSFDDDFADAVKVGESKAVIAMGWRLNAEASATTSLAPLKFGASGKGQIAATTFRELPEDTLFGNALVDVVKNFSVPTDAGDLRDLEPGTFCTVETSGSLKFSGSASMAVSTSVFATSAIGDALGALAPQASTGVNAGASVGVSGSFTLSTDYQVRVVKRDDNVVALGFYRKKGSAASISVTASAGLSAAFGEKDLLEELVKKLTGDTTLDEDGLKKAGLTPAQIGKIKGVLGKAVQSKLEASLQASIERSKSDGRAFLFEITLDQLDADGADAIAEALNGDLTGLTTGATPPAGIKRVRTIQLVTDTTTTSLRINLFGILNYMSLTKLLLKSQTATDEHGNLIIVDTATADRVKLFVNNTLDTNRLRYLMLESVIITAAYSTMPGAPKLNLNFSFFEQHASAKFENAKDFLDVAEALALITTSEKAADLRAFVPGGTQSLLASLELNPDQCKALFLAPDGAARTAEDYENIGRRALQALVAGDSGQAHRLPPATNDVLWSLMRPGGSFQGVTSLPAFAAANFVEKNAIYSDYIWIAWWAGAMSRLAETLAKMQNIGTADPKFNDHRKELGKRMKKVAADSGEHFSDPFGLVAIDLASNQVGKAAVKLTGAGLNKELARMVSAAGI